MAWGEFMSPRRQLPALFAAAPCLPFVAGAALPVDAADLTIGLGADVTALDPHYHNVTPNNNVAAHIFGYLVQRNEKSQLEPGLATEWKTVDPLTWEFKLRKGVKFHDGSDFTAADVVASIERVPMVPNSPSPFTAFTKQIREMIVVDPYTIRFKTATPYPLMPSDMTQVVMISKAAAKATTEDFNSGKAAIGTGPYKLVRYAKGDRIELARNDAYWGGRTPWEKVTLRILPQDASRVAALLSGDVQAIENVPTSDVAQLQARTGAPGVEDRRRPSHLPPSRFRPRCFAVRHRQGGQAAREESAEGRARASRDVEGDQPRCHRRQGDGGRGDAVRPARAEFLFGATKNLKVEPYDPEGAKKLLAEAGYPDGFGLTIHAPNNRYVNDAKIAQAVAQMLSRVGIDTKVVAMPSSTYFTQATELKFSFMLVGWSTGTGEASSSLKALLMTYNRDKGYGNANRGRYSNPKVDALTEDALATVDDAKREAYLQRATELAINDIGVIPLHFQVNLWAMRDGIGYVPRTDEYTLAWKFKPGATQGSM